MNCQARNGQFPHMGPLNKNRDKQKKLLKRMIVVI